MSHANWPHNVNLPIGLNPKFVIRLPAQDRYLLLHQCGLLPHGNTEHTVGFNFEACAPLLCSTFSCRYPKRHKGPCQPIFEAPEHSNQLAPCSNRSVGCEFYAHEGPCSYMGGRFDCDVQYSRRQPDGSVIYGP